MMTSPLTKAAKRRGAPQGGAHDGGHPGVAKRRRRWDIFFADPAAIESDYHRMARRHEDRSDGRRA
ncbi:MAG TPA: hypothetical protein VGG16_27025 [Streptosporangiaceae bacterium]|jgi:hypothetical protein